ncbi:hypothetical protein [Ochrobactrum soli]|uniref:Uncharacterized protein n=1 Tax=Ochrobactrum soli TaxID=2448455 RepID=A0A849KT58_9HYPH|nr:hypothetical protein [[Ochrobactrum] soli]NNU61889.1 hypothetical protein [[Ochrobactrum] soli]
MINDLTDEMFWLFTIGVCILFFIRLLSPPPPMRSKTSAQTLPRPRWRSRRRAFRERWMARSKDAQRPNA